LKEKETFFMSPRNFDILANLLEFTQNFYILSYLKVNLILISLVKMIKIPIY